MSVFARRYAAAGLLAFALFIASGFVLPNNVAIADQGQMLYASDIDSDAEIHDDGWAQDDAGAWHYWKDNEKCVSQRIDSTAAETPGKPAIAGMPDDATSFWLDSTGTLALNRVVDPTTEKDAGSYDVEADPGCVYLDKYGQVTKGKTKVGNCVYLANENGKLETGNKYGILSTSAYDKTKRVYYINPAKHCAVVTNSVVSVSGFGYVLPCNSGGYLLAGGKKTLAPTTIQKKKGIKYRVYLARSNGKLETGNAKTHILGTSLYDKTKRYYYINPSTHCALVTKKPVKVSGFGWVYPYYKGGYLITGKKIIRPSGKKTVGSKVYLARANGKLEAGNAKTHILGTSLYDKTRRYYYIDPSAHCAVVKSKPVKVKSFGWVFPYYSGGQLIVGRKVIKDKVYLARTNGKLETGDKQGFLSTTRYDSKKVKRKYYINPKTHAVTYGKPVYVSKFGYVYAPSSAGYLLTECKKLDSQHILLVEKNGKILNRQGWVRSSVYTGFDDRFWLERPAKNKKVFGARIGDFKVNGVKYRGRSNGALYHDMHLQVGDAYYWIDHNGKFSYDGVVTSLYRRAQGYRSPSRYLIMVDIDNPRTVVLEGRQGNWRVKFIWDCCTGHETSPTICGTFSVGAKGYSFGEEHGYSCYYWTQISGGYLFHTRKYYPHTWVLEDGSMGKRASAGCVRLYDDAAYWIWTQVPAGTTVACVY